MWRVNSQEIKSANPSSKSKQASLITKIVNRTTKRYRQNPYKISKLLLKKWLFSLIKKYHQIQKLFKNTIVIHINKYLLLQPMANIKINLWPLLKEEDLNFNLWRQINFKIWYRKRNKNLVQMSQALHFLQKKNSKLQALLLELYQDCK